MRTSRPASGADPTQKRSSDIEALQQARSPLMQPLDKQLSSIFIISDNRTGNNKTQHFRRFSRFALAQLHVTGISRWALMDRRKRRSSNRRPRNKPEYGRGRSSGKEMGLEAGQIRPHRERQSGARRSFTADRELTPRAMRALTTHLRQTVGSEVRASGRMTPCVKTASAVWIRSDAKRIRRCVHFSTEVSHALYRSRQQEGR